MVSFASGVGRRGGYCFFVKVYVSYWCCYEATYIFNLEKFPLQDLLPLSRLATGALKIFAYLNVPLTRCWCDPWQGFPGSVTPDYVPFQMWDSLQVALKYLLFNFTF